MENPSDKTLNQQVINNQRPSGSIVPQGQQNFIPITEMFDTPETLLADAISVNPDAVARIDYWKADIDKYGINAMASLGVANPSFATDTFDPVAQQNPPDNTFSKLKDAAEDKVERLHPQRPKVQRWDKIEKDGKVMLLKHV